MSKIEANSKSKILDKLLISESPYDYKRSSHSSIQNSVNRSSKSQSLYNVKDYLPTTDEIKSSANNEGSLNQTAQYRFTPQQVSKRNET